MALILQIPQRLVQAGVKSVFKKGFRALRGLGQKKSPFKKLATSLKSRTQKARSSLTSRAKKTKTSAANRFKKVRARASKVRRRPARAKAAKKTNKTATKKKVDRRRNENRDRKKKKKKKRDRDQDQGDQGDSSDDDGKQRRYEERQDRTMSRYYRQQNALGYRTRRGPGFAPLAAAAGLALGLGLGSGRSPYPYGSPYPPPYGGGYRGGSGVGAYGGGFAPPQRTAVVTTTTTSYGYNGFGGPTAFAISDGSVSQYTNGTMATYHAEKRLSDINYGKGPYWPNPPGQMRPSANPDSDEHDPGPDAAKAPFSAQDLSSLAAHSAIPHRPINSLRVIEGAHLLRFMEARDDYLNETSASLQVAKGLRLAQIAKYIDDRYHTHAQGWLKIMRNRPEGWSKGYAARFADTIDEDQMKIIAELPESKVASTIAAEPPIYTPWIDQTPIACSLSEVVGPSTDATLQDSSISPVKDRFTLFFMKQKKALVFHLNGMVEGLSFVNEVVARRHNIAEVVRIVDAPFVSKSMLETRCQHLSLFSQARMVTAMMRIFPPGFVPSTRIRDVLFSPARKPTSSSSSSLFPRDDEEEKIQFAFTNDLPKGVLYTIKPLKLSGGAIDVGTRELSTLNSALKAISAIATEYLPTLERLFPGST